MKNKNKIESPDEYKRITWPRTKIQLPKLPPETFKILARKYKMSPQYLYQKYRSQKDIELVKEALALGIALKKRVYEKEVANVTQLVDIYIEASDPMRKVYHELHEKYGDKTDDYLMDEVDRANAEY